MKIFLSIAVALFLVSCAHKGQSTKQETETQAHAKTQKTSQQAVSDAKAECTHGKDVRTLEVVKSGQGCELNYTKMGNTNKAATSVKGSTYCHTIFERIKGNLEKSGYKCN